MKYCIKCGKQIDDNAHFCPYCGNAQEVDASPAESPVAAPVVTPVSQPQPEPQPESQPEEDYEDYGEENHTNRNLIIAIIVVLVVAIIGGLAFQRYRAQKAAERARQDSIHLADSLAAVERHIVDSIARADSLRADSLANVELILSFVRGIHTSEGYNDIFSDFWVNKHCTPHMKKVLRDEYCYDGDGYGSWIVGGWGEGEDIESKLASATYDGEYAYATLKPTGYSTDYVYGNRVIRYEVSVEDGIVKLNNVEWISDYSYR